MSRRSIAWLGLLAMLAMLLMNLCVPAMAEADTRWADAADEIDKYLDAAFESYLDGDASAAYDNVSNAYFRVYETTGFERQTMSYISGNRKNAVEMQFSACKSEVRKENTDQDVIVRVRSALVKLKRMIREDGNKLAAQQGGAQSENKWYKRGEPVSTDPYPEYSADPNAAQKYESWYEAALLVKELLDTAYMGYLDKDFEAASDNLNTAYYSVYEESGLSHKIYTDLSQGDRQNMEAQFSNLRGLIATAAEKYQKNKYRTTTDKAKNTVLKLAKRIDDQEAEAKAAAAAEAGQTEEAVGEAKPSDPRLLTFLGAFGIIVREGAEVVLFYQPMLSEGNPGMVWAGFGVGCVVLVFVYLAITKLSVKLPLKVFFTATSILMAVMCVSFLGSGIKELAEGNVFDLSLRVPGIPENDVIQVFGIYPYLETLVPQLILSIILLVTFMMAHYRGKLDAQKAEYEAKMEAMKAQYAAKN